jgi:hypothetical protein
MEAARDLGVSHVMVYNTINHAGSASLCRKWRLEWVPLAAVVKSGAEVK